MLDVCALWCFLEFKFCLIQLSFAYAALVKKIQVMNPKYNFSIHFISRTKSDTSARVRASTINFPFDRLTLLTVTVEGNP